MIIVRLTPVMTAHLHQLRDSRSTDSINTLLIAAAAVGQTPKNTKSTNYLFFSLLNLPIDLSSVLRSSQWIFYGPEETI